jgi:hypothetical protein
VNRTKLSPANIVILAAGVVMLIASFMSFYRLPFPGGAVTANAWDRGLFLIATLPVLLGGFMALQVGLVAFGRIDMPNRLLGLTWDQVHLVLALQCVVLMLAFWAEARPPTVTFGAGFWLMFAAAIALVVGALMRIATTRRRPRAI